MVNVETKGRAFPFEKLTSPNIQVEPVPADLIVGRLQLNDHSPTLTHSVLLSNWYSIDQDRMYIEVRHPEKFATLKNSEVTYIVDLDDCLMAASAWHKQEYALLAEDVYLVVNQYRRADIL